MLVCLLGETAGSLARAEAFFTVLEHVGLASVLLVGWISSATYEGLLGIFHKVLLHIYALTQ